MRLSARSRRRGEAGGRSLRAGVAVPRPREPAVPTQGRGVAGRWLPEQRVATLRAGTLLSFLDPRAGAACPPRPAPGTDAPGHTDAGRARRPCTPARGLGPGSTSEATVTPRPQPRSRLGREDCPHHVLCRVPVSGSQARDGQVGMRGRDALGPGHQWLNLCPPEVTGCLLTSPERSFITRDPEEGPAGSPSRPRSPRGRAAESAARPGPCTASRLRISA